MPISISVLQVEAQTSASSPKMGRVGGGGAYVRLLSASRHLQFHVYFYVLVHPAYIYNIYNKNILKLSFLFPPFFVLATKYGLKLTEFL
jgi:hypothetical protein